VLPERIAMIKSATQGGLNPKTVKDVKDFRLIIATDSSM
jgi:hypothetical protein